ncbi:hypothetical protein TrVE_jg3959 [Triparma verrucosa]|uniref:START domain-containing protein n=1 Tax=Triparma verrucosa TaxID=1606542 RepID=A0A9W7B8K3_9STRA|nr:hypothetical protein TrVE_jg3959 [Triparma verrucosa]
MGEQVAYDVDLFFDYFKELAESNEAKAKWMKLEPKHWAGKKHVVETKVWLEETGAVGEWRCSTGDGHIDQARISYRLNCDVDCLMASVNSIKEVHAASVGTFMYIIDKGKDKRGDQWSQKYRAIKLPWPMRQRDVVYTEHIRKDGDDIYVFSRSSRDLDEATKEMSVHMGRIRADMKLAGYKIHPVDECTTEVTYLLSVDLGGPFGKIDYFNRKLAGRYMKGVVDMHRLHVEKSQREGVLSDPPLPLPLLSKAIAKLGDKRPSLVTSPMFAGMKNTDTTVEDSLNIEMGRMIKKTAGVVDTEDKDENLFSM